MPIYEYRCEACGHEHEVIQKASDALLVVCPACDARALKKKLTASAFRLSGSGWYETDFKTGNKKNIAGEAKSEKAGGKDGSPDAAGKTSDKKTGDSKASDKKDGAKPSKESSTSSGSTNKA